MAGCHPAALTGRRRRESADITLMNNSAETVHLEPKILLMDVAMEDPAC